MKFDFEREAGDQWAFMGICQDLFDDSDEAGAKAEIKEVAEWCNLHFARENWVISVRRDVSINISFDDLGHMQETEADRTFTVYVAFPNKSDALIFKKRWAD